jgi:hypothetical protein
MPATLPIGPSHISSDQGTTHGLSDEAQALSDFKSATQIETSITFGQRQVDLLMRLLDACNEASSDDETDPVSVSTYKRAEEFLNVIPPIVPLPDVMVHPDGEIAFEWHVGQSRVLTVSVGPIESIAFAALLGTSTVYGRESFTGFLPDQIAHLLGRLFPSQARHVSR